MYIPAGKHLKWLIPNVFLFSDQSTIQRIKRKTRNFGIKKCTAVSFGEKHVEGTFALQPGSAADK